MRQFVYDTAVFLYAVGTEHPYRAPCRRLLDLARDGRLVGVASVELVQEYIYVRLRRQQDRDAVLRDARDVAAVCKIKAFDARTLRGALSLLASNERLSARDAVHAATALESGIELIVSTDRAFEAVPGLTRVDPIDAERVLLS